MTSNGRSRHKTSKDLNRRIKESLSNEVMFTMASRLGTCGIEGRRRLGAATAVLFASCCVWVGGDHRVQGKAATGPHPHQGKVKVRNMYRNAAIRALATRIFLLYRLLANLDLIVSSASFTCTTTTWQFYSGTTPLISPKTLEHRVLSGTPAGIIIPSSCSLTL